MKIAIINCFDTYEERVGMLYNFFIKRNCLVNVFTSDFMHIEKRKRSNYITDYDYIKTIPYYKNISLSRIVSHYFFATNVFKKIQNSEFDLIWILLPPNSLIREAKYYKKIHSRTKVIADFIDMWPESMPVSNFFLRPISFFWKRLRTRNLICVDQVITECNLYQEILYKEFNKSKIFTLYLARKIEPIIIKKNYNNKKVILCYLGSINNLIDIRLIQKILYNTIEKYDIDLHIIGDGEKREFLINKCSETGTKVIYHGKIYESKKKKMIFDMCHYGINIMKESVFVGLSMKSMDYFAAGLPIINNLKGDTWDFVEKNKIGINISETYEIVPYMNDSIRIRTRDFFVNKFSEEAFESDLINIFNISSIKFNEV